MPQDLYTNLNAEFPPSFVTVTENLVLMATGVNKVLRWNGQRSSADTAGVIAPTQILSLSTPNAGAITIANSIVAYQRFVDYDGNVSDLSPVSASAGPFTSKRITYSNIEIPAETKVSRRQIFRTRDGGTSVVYLDIDTTDLTSTSLESNNTDSTISLEEAIVLTDEDNTPIANVHGVPPSNKSVLCSHQGRAFGAVEVSYTVGHVDVTNGSVAVGGIGTNWTQAMVGRYLYVVGASTFHQIAGVGTVSETGTQSLTLASAYTGPTDKFAEYAIRSEPDKRRSVAYTEALSYEDWPAINEFAVQETGSELTGLISQGAYLYILEREFIHRFTFGEAPEDGSVFLVAYRGSVNHRAAVAVGGWLYMLDEQGIHRYSGEENTTQISSAIQDIWRRGELGYQINWQASKWIHACHDPSSETIRWFVPLSGQRFCRHAIGYHIPTERFWLEEYPTPIGSSVLFRIDRRIPAIGMRNGEVGALGEQNLDGAVDAIEPHGDVTEGGVLSIADGFANFPADQVANVPVVIVSGRGKGQLRQVIANDGTSLTVRLPWLIRPDATSKYQIGGIPWKWRSGKLRWQRSDVNEDVPREIEVVYEPLGVAGWMDVRVYEDFESEPEVWRRERDDPGVMVEAETADIVVDMTHGTGQMTQRLDDGGANDAAGGVFVQVEMQGVGVKDRVVVHEVNVAGAG